MNGGDEDHGRHLKAGMLADHRASLEPVEIGHAHIGRGDGHVRPKQVSSASRQTRLLINSLRVPARSLIAEELGGLVINQKMLTLMCPVIIVSAAVLDEPHPRRKTHLARTYDAANAQRRQQLLGIDRLRQVVGSASLWHFSTVALHRFRRQRNDRKRRNAGLWRIASIV